MSDKRTDDEIRTMAMDLGEEIIKEVVRLASNKGLTMPGDLSVIVIALGCMTLALGATFGVTTDKIIEQIEACADSMNAAEKKIKDGRAKS